ncbi:MAG: 30S ribosomal protein S4 [Patescibacteria group bacterium]
MIGPKEKKERALGERLNLKGERCSSPKCAAVRKPYRPGVHGRSRRRALSEFGLQLKEKQKFKVSYGLDERNLRKIFYMAQKSKESSSAKLLEFLERRLDNVVFRLGLAPSRGAARQLIIHGHMAVNSRRVRSPGFLVKGGDIVSVRKESELKKALSTRKEYLKKYEPPQWLYLDREKMEGKILSLPHDETPPFEINLLIESLSK